MLTILNISFFIFSIAGIAAFSWRYTVYYDIITNGYLVDYDSTDNLRTNILIQISKISFHDGICLNHLLLFIEIFI